MVIIVLVIEQIHFICKKDKITKFLLFYDFNTRQGAKFNYYLSNASDGKMGVLNNITKIQQYVPVIKLDNFQIK